MLHHRTTLGEGRRSIQKEDRPFPVAPSVRNSSRSTPFDRLPRLAFPAWLLRQRWLVSIDLVIVVVLQLSAAGQPAVVPDPFGHFNHRSGSGQVDDLSADHLVQHGLLLTIRPLAAFAHGMPTVVKDPRLHAKHIGSIGIEMPFIRPSIALSYSSMYCFARAARTSSIPSLMVLLMRLPFDKARSMIPCPTLYKYGKARSSPIAHIHSE